MIIGINLLFLIPGKVGGTETYARELIRAIADKDTNNQYVIFLNQEARNWEIPLATNFKRVICPIVATSRIRRYVYEQILFPFLLRKYHIEILHSLGYVGPLITFCKHIVTIHDVNFVGHGASMPGSKRILLGFMVKATAMCSDKIIAISEFSKAEILRYLNVSMTKIRVIHQASFINGNEKFDSIAKETMLTESIRKKFIARDRYILAFSSLNTHKNIPALVSAYAEIQRHTDCNLVLVGNMLNANLLQMQISENKMQDFITVTGYVSDTEIVSLLSGARLFIFPSLYEGFGLPLLEAQSVGTCVICSDLGSLPEVGADSVEYFDPNSISDMAAKILHLLNSPERIAELQRRGFENIKRFSWARAASETLELYQSV